MEAIILTKSYMKKEKTGAQGSCVTAYDFRENRFVRFVSDTEGSPIPRDVSDNFSLFDVVSVRVLRPCPLKPQTENLLVDLDSFSKIEKPSMGIEEIYRRVPPPSFPRYMTSSNASFMLDSVAEYNHSLELVRVSNLCVFPIFRDNHQRTRANFQFNSRPRKLYRVTAPDAIERVKDGNWTVSDAYMMVSIPTDPAEDDHYYKFVAAIYPVHQPGFQGQR